MLQHTSHRYSYRFVFLPGAVGAIAWLALNENSTARIRHGLVLAGVGDHGSLTYKRSRRGDASIDIAMEHLVMRTGGDVRDFDPYGYAERQYCSPGFDLPVGVLMRTPYGTYPEYHTSGDDLTFLSTKNLQLTLDLTCTLVHLLETDRTCRNTSPKCEPQLGKRGLYGATGGGGIEERQMALLWVLNLSDGTRSLLQIANRSRLPYPVVERAAADLENAGLLETVHRTERTPGAAPYDPVPASMENQ